MSDEELKKLKMKKYQEEYRNKPENKIRRKELNRLWREKNPEYHKEYYLKLKNKSNKIESKEERNLLSKMKGVNKVLGLSLLVIISQSIYIIVNL